MKWKGENKKKSNGKNREEVGKEGRPKLKGKKIKWGRREREGGKGIKNKREREKKTKKGRSRKGKS